MRMPGLARFDISDDNRNSFCHVSRRRHGGCGGGASLQNEVDPGNSFAELRQQHCVVSIVTQTPREPKSEWTNSTATFRTETDVARFQCLRGRDATGTHTAFTPDVSRYLFTRADHPKSSAIDFTASACETLSPFETPRNKAGNPPNG